MPARAATAALTLGDGGSANNQRKSYTGLAVFRALQSDWIDEADVGIRIRNIDACVVDIRRAERFTIGVQLVGDARGCEDSDLRYGRLVRQPHRPRPADLDRQRLDELAAPPGRALRLFQRDQSGDRPLRRAALGCHRRLPAAQRASLHRPGLRAAAPGHARHGRCHPLPGGGGWPRPDRPRACGWKPARPSSRATPAASPTRATRSPMSAPTASRDARWTMPAPRGPAARCCRCTRRRPRWGRRGWSPRRRTSAPAPSAGTAPRPASRAWPCCPAIPPGRPRP